MPHDNFTRNPMECSPRRRYVHGGKKKDRKIRAISRFSRPEVTLGISKRICPSSWRNVKINGKKYPRERPLEKCHKKGAQLPGFSNVLMLRAFSLVKFWTSLSRSIRVQQIWKLHVFFYPFFGDEGKNVPSSCTYCHIFYVLGDNSIGLRVKLSCGITRLFFNGF